ncbi:MAG: histidine--tRNA ligase [Chloroflexota bacterium]
MPQFSTPRGTQDVLPDDWPFWDHVHAHAQRVAAEYGYRRIETPTFGETSLFSRSAGEGSDIVDKEMYTFEDRGGDSLTLRPEGTAPVMRAYLQHGMHLLPQPVKLFYLERMYRYDRPQRGRLREHHQFGCEAIGSDDGYVDVEMIDLLNTFHRRLGLNHLSLNLNTIGDRDCRPQYVKHLVDYLRAEKQNLDPLDRERLERNPLRVLDSKERASQATIQKAPHIMDFLCHPCLEHWNKLQRGLNALEIPFTINHRLVRGLDYYTRTVFEFVPAREGSQSTVDAGGRYDALSEAIGGPSVPGMGFGCGLERLILELREIGISVPTTTGPDVYVAYLGAAAEDAALQMAAQLRHAGTTTAMGFGGRSIKSQLKHANAVNARFAAILGDDELARRTVTLRSLREHAQIEVPIDSIAEHITQ